MVFLRFEELRFLWRCRILSSHLERPSRGVLKFSIPSPIDSCGLELRHGEEDQAQASCGGCPRAAEERPDHGRVQSSAGKAKWTVRWDEGPLKGTVAAQSSKSLRLWQVDFSAFDAGEAGSSDSSEEEGAEEPAPEVDHPERKRKFEVYAKTLEGKTVKVRPFKRVLALRTSGLTMISPPPFLFFNRSWTRASAR